MSYKLIVQTQDAKREGGAYTSFHGVKSHECKPEGLYINLNNDSHASEVFMPWSAEGGINAILVIEGNDSNDHSNFALQLQSR
ncbi:MAG: hypothetical protein R3230_00900 [Nitrosopumilaceae archaeon]|nr:hypothetical protein [Nitrosopumilaceae archaeon]